jgi:hypothetical protein
MAWTFAEIVDRRTAPSGYTLVRARFVDNGSARVEEAKFDHDPSSAELVATRIRILARLNAAEELSRFEKMRLRIIQLRAFIVSRGLTVPAGDDE